MQNAVYSPPLSQVVRGADLLTSTCRQLLLYRALGLPEPAFFHTPLVLDSSGVRLAKRHDALSLRAMREQGASPEGLRGGWVQPEAHPEVTGISVAVSGEETVEVVEEERERRLLRRLLDEQTAKEDSF